MVLCKEVILIDNNFRLTGEQFHICQILYSLKLLQIQHKNNIYQLFFERSDRIFSGQIKRLNLYMGIFSTESIHSVFPDVKCEWPSIPDPEYLFFVLIEPSHL